MLGGRFSWIISSNSVACKKFCRKIATAIYDVFFNTHKKNAYNQTDVFQFNKRDLNRSIAIQQFSSSSTAYPVENVWILWKENTQQQIFT